MLERIIDVFELKYFSKENSFAFYCDENLKFINVNESFYHFGNLPYVLNIYISLTLATQLFQDHIYLVISELVQ